MIFFHLFKTAGTEKLAVKKKINKKLKETKLTNLSKNPMKEGHVSKHVSDSSQAALESYIYFV